jgi:dTDP-4-amino-4,6-dideoxygalactose transaminase
LHQQVCFRELGYRDGDFPVSEQAAREVLALPVHSALSKEDVEYVSQVIRAFWR